MKRSKYPILNILIVTVLVFSAVMFSACDNSTHSGKNYETLDGYGGITTEIFSRNNIALHIEDKVDISKDEISDILNTVENDYRKLQSVWKKNSRIDIYIIDDKYILGSDRGAYLNGNIICDPDIIKDGSYKLFLTSAYLDTTDAWKQYAACQYAFSQWNIEELDLRTYYADDENLLTLTLFAAYFNDNFSDNETIEMVKQTAYDFGNFVLTTYGLNNFLSAGMMQYRQEWLDKINCEQSFELSLDLSWLDGARYSQKFLQYPLVIETDNRIYYLDDFSASRPTASFDTPERILYHLSTGYSECIKIMDHIRTNAPQSYTSAAARFQDKIEYRISDRELKTSCDADNKIIYLLDPSEYVHETVHAITLSSNPTNGAWLCEGIAEYFSRSISDSVSDMGVRLYESFTLTNLSGKLKEFADAVNVKYENMGGRFDDPETFDVALLEEAIGITTLLYPDFKSQIAFPLATTSIYDAYYTSYIDGNKLTYPEAYAFSKYLIDRYGTDKVLQCCSSYEFESMFGKPYSDVFTQFHDTLQI